MARPKKDGFDYFPLNTNFFSDRKIRMLGGNFGGDGIALYVYILCEVYEDKGYYLTYNDDFIGICAADLHVTPEKIGLIVNYMLKQSLFDNTLFSRVNVLTSHSIQLQYQKMCENRSKSRSIAVDEALWILKDFETQGFIKCTQKDSFYQNNDFYPNNDFDQKDSFYRKNDFYRNNDSNYGKNTDKYRNNPQSKVKEKYSKVKESSSAETVVFPVETKDVTTTTNHKFGKYENVILSEEKYNELKEKLPKTYEYYIARLSEHMFSTGKTYDDHLYRMLYWADKDCENGKVISTASANVASIDDDEKMRAYAKRVRDALKRSNENENK